MSTNENTEIPWVEKYRPQFTNQMIESETTNNLLRKFLDEFFTLQLNIKNLNKELKESIDPQVKKKAQLKLKSYQSKLLKNKARLLIGPPGVGKTTAVYALAKDLDLTVIELNASDARTEEALNEKLHETVKSTNLLSFTQKKVKNKLILIDEVDGIHGQSDRGGVATLEKIIQYSKYPIIMTCNFRDDKKFKSLYDLASPLIEVSPASPQGIAHLLKRIALEEKISLTDSQLKQLAIQANGDYRSAINDLQGIAQGGSGITDELILSLNMKRDTDAEIAEFLRDLFSKSTIREARKSIDDVLGKEIDFRTIHKWINENLLQYLSSRSDIQTAYDHLSRADSILGYIGRTQDYGHLSYFFDLIGSIALTKSDKVLPKSGIRPPQWFRTRAAPDDEVALILQKLYRCSLNEVMRSIQPNMQLFLKYQKSYISYLAALLNATELKIMQLYKMK